MWKAEASAAFQEGIDRDGHRLCTFTMGPMLAVDARWLCNCIIMRSGADDGYLRALLLGIIATSKFKPAASTATTPLRPIA